MAEWSEWIQEIGTIYAESELGSNNQNPPPSSNPQTGQVYDQSTQQSLAAMSNTTAKTLTMVAWAVAGIAALTAVVLIARR